MTTTERREMSGTDLVITRCPTCRAEIYVRTCQSKAFKGPKFFRWCCRECSWFDKIWHKTKAKAQQIGARV
jgi:hypothetical protein